MQGTDLNKPIGAEIEEEVIQPESSRKKFRKNRAWWHKF